MRRITAPKMPKDFGCAPSAELRARVSAWLAADPATRKRVAFDDTWSVHCRAFAEEQKALCAYCEDRTVEQGTIDHYRPKGEVTVLLPGATREEDPYTGNVKDSRTPKTETKHALGYWFLADDWSNWLLACKRCNNWKSSHFPVRLAHSINEEDDRSSEQPLILDPRAMRATEDHFAYDAVGEVRGLTDEGKATVHTLGLNRRLLLNRRRVVATIAFRHCETVAGLRDRGVGDPRDIEDAARWLLRRFREPPDPKKNEDEYYAEAHGFYGMVRAISAKYGLDRAALDEVVAVAQKLLDGSSWP